MELRAEKIAFHYGKGKRQILENFDLTVTSEERVGIIAPSGFGKTTLCKLLAGYEKADEGEIYLEKRPLSSYKGFCPVQMIWQHPEQVINPKLRMKAVLEEAKGIDQRILMGLGIKQDWMNRYPTEISGGEMQRFCIARALSDGTQFILADEISTMLDLITQSQIWSFLIEETQKRGIGLLAVSHSEPLIHQISTRIINMKSGVETKKV